MFNKIKDLIIKFLHGAKGYRVVYESKRGDVEVSINYPLYTEALRAYNSIVNPYSKEFLMIRKSGKLISMQFHTLRFLDDYGV